MKFALNYSTQAAQLLIQGLIDIDLYKCPDWPDLIAAAQSQKPVYIHFDLVAGSPNINSVDWDKVKSFLDQTQTYYVNMHIAPRKEHFPHIQHDIDSPDSIKILKEQILNDIALAIQHFGTDRVILEHIPYFGPNTKYIKAATDPYFVNDIICESNCGLILDLSHASIAARNLGFDEQQYISILPLNRLRELHITGHQHDGKRYQEHLALSPENWAIVEWALDNIQNHQWPKPWVVAFEYGGIGPIFEWRSEASVLAEQVPGLYDLVKTITLNV